MAKIWRVYEGREPTLGEPWINLPLAEAISAFDVRPEHFLSDLATTPRFGDADRDLWYRGHKHIVVEVGRGEGLRSKWKPGFYRSPVDPEDALGRLIQETLLTQLGSENVVRVESEPTEDTQGRDALKITVVITPQATARLGSGATLNALVRLQGRLRELGDERMPIVEYATEAELEQDAAS